MRGPCLFLISLAILYPLLFNLSGSSERGQKKTRQSAKILGEQEYAHQTHDKFA